MSVFFKIRKDGTTAWFYDFTYNKIRYRGVGGATKSQAMRTQEKIRDEVLTGEFGLANRVGNPPIEDFAKTFLERRKHIRSHKRDALSARTLLKFFKGKVLLSIKPQDIEEYIGQRRNEGVTPATINRELACFKRMYNLAIKWGDAKKNPVNDVDFLEEPPGRTRFLSEDECQRLINRSASHLKPILITALNTGLRLGEILSLQWQQVHIDSVAEPCIEVIHTKNNKTRFVPLNDDMVTLLSSLRRDSEYVFLGARGKPLKSVRKPFESALKRTGISGFRFHDLRHTFASHYVMSGGDILSLKAILGHSSMRMVERYTHLASSHQFRLVNNLNGRFSICHPNATWPSRLRILKKSKAP